MVWSTQQLSKPPAGYMSVPQFAKYLGVPKDHVVGMVRRTPDPIPTFKDESTNRIFIPIVKGRAWYESKGKPTRAERNRIHRAQISAGAIDRLIRRLDAAKYPKSVIAFQHALEVYATEVLEKEDVDDADTESNPSNP